MDNIQYKNNINPINNLYEKIGYFDKYGSSVILIIIITIISILLFTYLYILTNIQPIKDDWINQRCKPYVIPFAGFINKPSNMSVNDYTKENFYYCNQTILKNISGPILQPLTFTISALNQLSIQVSESLNSIRYMTNKVRNNMQYISSDIFERTLNYIIPLQQIIITFKDILGKTIGIVTASLFTLLGSYYSLKSLLAIIANFLIKILITMAIVIAIFWLIPFTWGQATAMTAIFVSISVPLLILLSFMRNVLQIRGDFNMPTLKVPKLKCFDKNTKLTLNNGKKKKISEIKVGDKLINENEVTAIIKVETNGSNIYILDDIIVSDTHKIKYNNKWIRVDKHPRARRIYDYNEPYLYCINTSNKVINIKIHEFSDWDEVFDEDINKLETKILNVENKCGCEIHDKQNKLCEYDDLILYNCIHKQYEYGFFENTPIVLKNKTVKYIKNIEIGDILQNNEIVYGVVEINGADVNKQCEYTLGKNTISGGPNIYICTNKTNIVLKENKIYETEYKQGKLYNLLTDKGFFYIYDTKFYDYNASIDILLDKNKTKLLSMKYV